MNTIKSQFTIKDLENFSGIKAHTIRIWEKRYDLLKPNRTDSNIRYYDTLNLFKILNVSLLKENGYKISKIANFSDEFIDLKVRELTQITTENKSLINSLKLAMLGFNEKLFNEVYYTSLTNSSLRNVFMEVFLPFLSQIGVLWQLKSISPTHEHFITNLIKQKIYSQIEKIPLSDNKTNKEIQVLFLPKNEIHELSLLFFHYEILLKGNQSIYLGQSIPKENLKSLKNHFPKVNFVTYLTVEPSSSSLLNYLESFQKEVLENTKKYLICYWTKN